MVSCSETAIVTSPCQTGLVVLAMMADRRSCPWWLKMGKTLLFPGWMDIFRYGSGLKNIPFFRPVARRSARKHQQRKAGENETALSGKFVFKRVIPTHLSG